MKRIGNLWQAITQIENLLAAYYKARKGKQQRDAVAAFGLNLEHELFTLQYELKKGCYQPGAYRQFIIHERKPRLISAAPFRDRVIHHAVMNVLEPILDKRFYYHSYACRRGKGVHKAVDQYQQWANKYPYVLKLDIAGYFHNISHKVLKLQLQRIIKDQYLLRLLELIIDESPKDYRLKTSEKGVGLPIGNLTSQYFANLYLNDIDHWLCQQSSVKAYLRYVDDLLIFGENKDDLWQLKNTLSLKLSTLGLTIHSRKQQLMRTTERVDVLGYKVSPKRRWLRNDNGYRFQQKLKRYKHRYQRGLLTSEQIKPSIDSWVGHAYHAETIGLRKQLFHPAKKIP